ncbi:MAG: hypothetical protein U0V72_00585 [Cytophagales bacterium]
MKTIVFNKNYNNKLNADCYTTLRLFNPYEYYVGECYSIMLDKRIIHHAELVYMQDLPMAMITPAMAWIDTGTGVHELHSILQECYKGKTNILPSTRMHFLIFKKIK